MTFRPTRPRLDRHWLRSVIFTVGLVGIIAVATDAEPEVTAVAIAFSALAFGFFYVVIPGGAHFGMVTANLLAIYFCLFEFFRHANFNTAPRGHVLVGLGLPVVGFLIGCLIRRQAITDLIDERQYREIALLPRLSRWFVAAMAIGAASFALPEFALTNLQLGWVLLSLQALITLLVVVSLHDVVLVMVDIATVFELVARRLDRLLMPMLAFLTFYALLVIIFACLCRIADMTTLAPQFIVNGEARRLQFVEALYFSVVTIATVGYGDILPNSMLVRAMSGIEIVCGILMLLFGFSEVMRSAGPDSTIQMPSPRRRRDSDPYSS